MAPLSVKSGAVVQVMGCFELLEQKSTTECIMVAEARLEVDGMQRNAMIVVCFCANKFLIPPRTGGCLLVPIPVLWLFSLPRIPQSTQGTNEPKLCCE